DGKKLVFASSNVPGSVGRSFDVCLKDLETGKKTVLAAAISGADWPAISRDGSKVAYRIYAAGPAAIYVVETRGGPPERVCEDCGAPWHWSSDGKKILYYWANKRRLGLLNIASGEKMDLLKHPKFILA